MKQLRSALALVCVVLSACGAQVSTHGELSPSAVSTLQPRGGSHGPTHVQNWANACASAAQTCTQAQNVGIAASWMAAHVDWNEVYYRSADDATSQRLAAAGAKHIVVYVDPNITAYCPVPAGASMASPDFPENGVNCNGPVSQYLHPDASGSYAHDYQHDANGGRLFDHADGLWNGQAQEPLYIGDADVQAAFHEATMQNTYATDVFEDDAGGYYDTSYWIYKYGETAVEWDDAANPQQAYANDAIATSNASAHPVIGNDGAGTDQYDLEWLAASSVEGAMDEHAWDEITTPSAWIARADEILTYHSLHKLMIEENTDASRLLFELASYWLVYDPTYSVEFLASANPAASTAGTNDTTFPEESIVPSQPLVATPASNDATLFQTAPGLFVREYARCYENGVPIGACAAVVNASDSAQNIAALTQQYGHVLVQNTSATWAAGGTPVWSTAVPSTIGAGQGLIFAQ